MTAQVIRFSNGPIDEPRAALAQALADSALEELTLHFHDSGDTAGYRAAVAAVCAARPGVKRLLLLDDGSRQVTWPSPSDLVALWSACPQLEELRCHEGQGVRVTRDERGAVRVEAAIWGMDLGGSIDSGATALLGAAVAGQTALVALEVTLLGYGRFDYEEIAEVIRSEHRPALRTLSISFCSGDHEKQLAHLGDVGGAIAACPGLERLTLPHGVLELGDHPHFPALRELTLDVDRFDDRQRLLRHAPELSGDFSTMGRSGMWLFADASFPALERLSLDFHYGAREPWTLADLAPLLRCETMPRLRDLALLHTPFADALCGALAAAPWAKSLERLDVTSARLTDAGRAALRELQARLPGLREVVARSGH